MMEADLFKYMQVLYQILTLFLTSKWKHSLVAYNLTRNKKNKTKQNKTKTKQNKTKQNKTKQNKTKQNKTKQNKTKHKTKQNKTKQTKNKWKGNNSLLKFGPINISIPVFFHDYYRWLWISSSRQVWFWHRATERIPARMGDSLPGSEIA